MTSPGRELGSTGVQAMYRGLRVVDAEAEIADHCLRTSCYSPSEKLGLYIVHYFLMLMPIVLGKDIVVLQDANLFAKYYFPKSMMRFCG